MKTLYTVKDVAEMFQLTERTIRNYIADGKLKHIKLGGNVRITQEHIDQFLKGE